MDQEVIQVPGRRQRPNTSASRTKGRVTWSAPNHVIHYPLNGIDLDFSKFKPRRFGPCDVMAHRMMQTYLFPGWPPRHRRRGEHQNTRRPQLSARLQHIQNVAMDLKTMDQMLHTTSYLLPEHTPEEIMMLYSPGEEQTKITEKIDPLLQVLQRYYMETSNPEMRIWLSSRVYQRLNAPHIKGVVRDALTPLGFKEQQHLQSYANRRFLYQELFLYSGQDMLPHRRAEQLNNNIGHPGAMPPLRDVRVYDNHPACEFLERHCWEDIVSLFNQNSAGPGRPRLTRSQSQPSSRLRPFHTCLDNGKDAPGTPLFFRPLSTMELDHRTRRRSLSRRHIRRMFHEPRLPLNGTFSIRNYEHYEPELYFAELDARGNHPRCGNCGLPDHTPATCIWPCGFCGAKDHKALGCPVSPHNRCRCSPFPNYHRASQCRVRCSRRCGSRWPPGHRRHKNAMTCESRCCMCGLRGHSGMFCSFRRCKCGEHHLGQDCGWNPACRVPGCTRYLCGEHCRECGSTAKPFIAWVCQACLRNDRPTRQVADEDTAVMDLFDSLSIQHDGEAEPYRKDS